MKKDINEIMIDLKKVANKEYYAEDLFSYEECQTLYDFIVDLQERYKKSCETYQQALDETMSEKMFLEEKIKQALLILKNEDGTIPDYKMIEDTIKCLETKEKIKFWLDGCDISFLAIAPEDITLKQLLKQCNRIKPEWCTCGINSKNIEDYNKVEIIIDYDDVKKVDDTVSCDILETKGDE